MKLSFYAKEDALVRYPGVAPAIGQAARYIGREFVPGETKPIPGTDKRQTVKPASNPASREAVEFDSDSDAGQAAARHCRKLALWPADKATAVACGVEFIDVEFVDGMWLKKAEKPAAKLKETA